MQNTETVHINTLLLKITDNSLTIKLEARTTYPYLNKGKGSHSRFYKTVKKHFKTSTMNCTAILLPYK